jgi:hypothetical protein
MFSPRSEELKKINSDKQQPQPQPHRVSFTFCITVPLK